jgi:hypothetical protein
VIHVDFSRPPEPPPDLRATFATSMLESLQQQGVDRLDIAEAVADQFVEQWHEASKHLIFSINHSHGDDTPEFQRDMIDTIVSQINEVLAAHSKVAVEKIGGSLAKAAHGAALMTTILLMRG